MYPNNLRYSKNHEWLKVEGNKVTIGVTEFAQQHLGDVVFVELPNIGQTYEVAESLGVIESVKAVSDVYSPVSGEVLEVNDDLETSPELINSAPYTDGWIAVIEFSDASQLDDLLTADAYQAYLKEGE